MTPEQFAYWLQGFAEMHCAPPDEAQWKMVKDHLKTVFFKVTPPLYVHPLDKQTDWQLIPPAIC